MTTSKKHLASQYTQQHLEQFALSEQHPFITMLHFHTLDQITVGFRPLLNSSVFSVPMGMTLQLALW